MIVHPQPVGILAQLLGSCGETAEREATLEALHACIGAGGCCYQVSSEQRHVRAIDKAGSGAQQSVWPSLDVECGHHTSHSCSAFSHGSCPPISIDHLTAQVHKACTQLGPASLCQGHELRLQLGAVDGPEANRLAVVSERGWEAWLLDLLTDGSTCTAASQVSVPVLLLHD